MIYFRIKVIEETILTMEKKYTLDLTDGPDSFLAQVFNRIFEDKSKGELDWWDFWGNWDDSGDQEKMQRDISATSEIFRDAVCKELETYHDGALKKECDAQKIAFDTEVLEVFRTVWERFIQTIRKSDSEDEEENEEIGYPVKEEYRPDASADQLIRQGKRYLLQEAVRNINTDDEGIFYFANRMMLCGLVKPENTCEDGFYYALEAVKTCRDAENGAYANREYLRTEIYDSLFREIFEKYGRNEFYRGHYVLEIDIDSAFESMCKEICEKADFCHEHAMKETALTVGKIWYEIAAQCLGDMGRLLVKWKDSYGVHMEKLVVFGPYCLYREGIPKRINREKNKRIQLTFGSSSEEYEIFMRFEIELNGRESDVWDLLEDILTQNALSTKDKEEYQEGYYYQIDQQKVLFDVDIHIVINSFVEKFDDRICAVRINYVGYTYTMKDIKYLGDSFFYSKQIIVNDRDQDGEYVCTIQNCRFYDLFTMPLRLTASIREGSVWLNGRSYKMTCFFNPVCTEITDSKLQGEESIICYNGTILINEADGRRLYKIKGKMKQGNDSGLLLVSDTFPDNIMLRGLGYLSCFMMSLCEIISIEGDESGWKKGDSILLYTNCFRTVSYVLQEREKTRQALNAFLHLKDEERENVWDEIIDYTNNIFPLEENISFSFLHSDERSSIKCKFTGGCSLGYHIWEEEGDDRNCIREVHAVIPNQKTGAKLYLRMPYIYDYNQNYISFHPFSISLFFEEDGVPPILLDRDHEGLKEADDFLTAHGWTLQDLIGIRQECYDNAAELIQYLCAPEKKEIEVLPEKEGKNLSLYDQVLEILSKDSKYHMNDQVIREICLSAADYLCWKYRRRQFIGKINPVLPNYVFLGGPGSGKSSLVRKLAKEVFGAKYYETTPSELKGLYIGHTRGVFLEKIDELQCQKNLGEDAPAVLFLDEAYTLFQEEKKQSEADKDIIALLLTIMQHTDQKISYQIEKKDDDGQNNAVKKTIVIKANTVIWMAGYEKEMRKALSSNPGIFRRVSTVVLPDPKTGDLWRRFQDIIQEAGEENRLLIERKKPEILKFFRWGSTVEHAEFFGSYSGARKLAENMVNMLLLLDKDVPEDKKEKELDYIIDAQKKEIRRQYQIVISKNERLPFEVISDLEENLDHYIGNNSVREQMREIVDMMVDVDFYKKRHVIIPKGALLKGYPGTGKTYLARCMAGELSKRLQEKDSEKRIAFIPVASTELGNEKLISALFSAAEEYEAAVIFIDEIDAIGKQRKAMWNDGPLIQLMKEMDGFDDRKTVFVLAATNAPETLDPALKRAGRFDLQFEIRYPNREERKELICFYAKELFCSIRPEILEEAGKAAFGYAPADIREVINETALLYYRCENRLKADTDTAGEAVRNDTVYVHRMVKDSVQYPGARRVERNGKFYWKADSDSEINQDLFLLDFKEIIAKKALGERITGEEGGETFQTESNTGRSAIAIHEVGHAMVYVWQKCDVEKITVLARGEASGYVKINKQNVKTRNNYLAQIKAALGGRAAEEIFYQDNISIGASNDLYRATELARSMVVKYGMGDSVGLMSLIEDKKSYLENDDSYTCSEEYRKKADEEVQMILESQYSEVKEYLTQYKKQLAALAEYIFEKEEISGEEFIAKCSECGVREA